jgi:hypothetical protein
MILGKARAIPNDRIIRGSSHFVLHHSFHRGVPVKLPFRT